MAAYDRKHQHTERRRPEPTQRGVRAASLILLALVAVLLGLTLGAAVSAGLFDLGAVGGWR